MDKVNKIKAYLENQKAEYRLGKSSEAKYRMEAYTELLDYINSLQEESVSEDLEEAAKAEADKMLEVVDPELASTKYLRHTKMRVRTFDGTDIEDAFKAGANWQKEQFEKNRLAACDAQTKEEAEREIDFVEKIIMEEHRQPTYSDAIEYGMKKMKEKMMKDSIDATIEHMPNDYGEFRPCIHVKVDRSFKKGERVKVIIIKEE